jgi:hypothetical protein
MDKIVMRPLFYETKASIPVKAAGMVLVLMSGGSLSRSFPRNAGRATRLKRAPKQLARRQLGSFSSFINDLFTFF